MRLVATRDDVLSRLKERSLEHRIKSLHSTLSESAEDLDIVGSYDVVATYQNHIVIRMHEDSSYKRVHFADVDGDIRTTCAEDIDLPPITQEESTDSCKSVIGNAVVDILNGGKDNLSKLVASIGSGNLSSDFIIEMTLSQIKNGGWWVKTIDENIDAINQFLSGRLEELESQKPVSRFKPGQELSAKELALAIGQLKELVGSLRGRITSTSESISEILTGSRKLDESTHQFVRLVSEATEDLNQISRLLDRLTEMDDVTYIAQVYERLVPIASRAVTATGIAEQLLSRCRS